MQEVSWYVRNKDGAVYGPAKFDDLIVWARDGRIDPASLLSQDRIEWTPAQLKKELEREWRVETEPGKFFGPFNRQVVIRIFNNHEAPEGAVVYRKHNYEVDKDPDPQIVEVEKIVEKIVEVEKIV